MKRFFASLATFSLVETIGRHPALALGVMTLLGVGGPAVVANLMTPTIVPFASSNFNPNQSGATNNGLKPNGGTDGALRFPTTATNSVAYYFEATVNPNLSYGFGVEAPFFGAWLNDYTVPGQPNFFFQRIVGGIQGSQWWLNPGQAIVTGGSATAGSNYATGIYPFTVPSSIVNCTRQPTGVWQPLSSINVSSFQQVDPGFGCPVATPSLNAAAIAANVPGSGAQQATGAGPIATTCTNNSPVSTEVTVTAHVAVAHGITPGQTFALGSFSTGAFNTNYTALPGTSGTTLVGEASIGSPAGTCPTLSGEGTALSGTGGAINFPAVSPTIPFGAGSTGVTVKAGQHICGWLTEYGSDSAFPGAASLEMVDEKGNALPGSPALVPTPNQSDSNFTGYTQTTGSPNVLTVTLPLKTFPITSAAVSGSQIAFTLPATTGNTSYVPGSEFTVSGLSSSNSVNVNLTYIVTSITGSGPYIVTGNPLSGPDGIPHAIAAPGTITGSGTLVSVILPGQTILGATPGPTYILPYGTNSTTGVGAEGTYALSANQTVAIGSSGSPATIFTFSSFYYTAAVNGSIPAGGTVSPYTNATIQDFIPTLGAAIVSVSGSVKDGWGGSLGNFADLWGVLPSQSGGAPSMADLASICTKQTDIANYAQTKGITVHSLYRMNDPGIWGESSAADFTGSISGTALSIGSTQYGATTALASGAVISGAGITGCPASCPTISSGSGASYVLSGSGGTVALEPMKAGAFKPAAPIQSNTLKGYIDTTLGVSTLHVTSLDDGTAHSGFARFTGTLGTSFTASVAASTSSNGAPTGSGLLTVTAPGGAPPNSSYIGIGTVVCPSIATPAAFTCTTVTGYAVSPATPGQGLNGSYVVDNPAVVTSQVMFGSGTLPGPATTLQVASVTGTIVAGMAVSDGGASLTAAPLLVTVGLACPGTCFSVAGNYYPPISADATMVASLTTLVPGEYLQNSTITNPVKIVPDPTNGNGLSGTYKLSGSPNASGVVGSSGSPVVLTGTTITDGGAIAPGPALTIDDKGPAITFPLTNIGAKTGTLALSGTYDVPTLGGTPSGIQVLVSNSANGPPLTGCTPCNWGALTAAISGGKWSGTITGIPGGGPYLVSVRATNGTAYATLPNSVKVGFVFVPWGQGQADSMQSAQSGTYTSFFSGLWGYFGWSSPYAGIEHYLQGPPVTANFVPGQPSNYAGDRFGVQSNGSPLSEAVSAFDQELGNIFGVPTSFMSATRDGIGVAIFTLGNATQTQTVGAGDGSTLVWCSASKFCPTAGVSPAGPLVFGAASLTGGWFTGAITNPGSVPTLTIGASGRIGGALEPGMVLNTPNAPTLVMCLTGCSSQLNYNSSTWLLSNALDAGGGSIAMRADPVGGAPWPNFNIQGNGSVFNFGGFGWPLVKAGTFTVSVNGTVVCQDSGTFAYNQTGGNCTGATIASSFVNYQTGDYEITFTSGHAPASSAAVVASWTNIISPETVTNAFNRPQGIGYFGDGTCQSGAISALFCKAPGGVSGHIYSGMGTDHELVQNDVAPSNVGYQWGALGYSQMVSWLYDTKFPTTIPGASAGVSFLNTGQWRQEGPVAFSTTKQDEEDSGLYDQWAMDAATKSTFNAHIVSGILGLDGNATGPMWEGEIIDCAPVTTTCTNGPLGGVYITGLHAGSPAGWGAIGSTYDLAGSPLNVTSSSQPMQNPVYYSGSGPAYYAGALNDIIVQTSGLPGTVVRNVHPSNGFAGGRRATSRWAALIYGANGGNATDPQLSRANDSAGGTPSPAFDYGNTYAASATGTVATVGGVSVVTFGGGITAHARPFVDGQWVTCASCTAQVITSVSVPPTQSTASGAGEVGQSFTITLSGALGVTGSNTITAGCHSMSGSGGSNCINVDASINVGGTFGIAAALESYAGKWVMTV